MENIAVFHDRGPVDIGIVETFEKRVGVRFPSDYKGLVTKHDALRPELRHFKYKYQGKEQVGDISFFGYGDPDDPEAVINVQETNYITGKIVVFGGTANGDYVVFDYRNSLKSPSIGVMLHDVFEDNGELVLLHVSDNFLSFVNSLISVESLD